MQFTKSIAGIASALCITYAALGNAFVLVALTRRKTPVRFIWAGTPFYLYRICNRSEPPASRALRIFALSTNIAVLLAVTFWLWFAVLINN